MKKIALPQEGLETLYGAHDGNLKHIESVLGVQIRTQGGELIVEGDRAGEARVERIFDQLLGLMSEGYDLRNGDVRTAAQLVAGDENVCTFMIGGFMTSATIGTEYHDSVEYPGGKVTVGQPYAVKVMPGWGDGDPDAGKVLDLGTVRWIELAGDPYRAPEFG